MPTEKPAWRPGERERLAAGFAWANAQTDKAILRYQAKISRRNRRIKFALIMSACIMVFLAIANAAYLLPA